MANAKISDTNVFVDTITDIKNIGGFAAYSTSSPTGNAAMSGDAIVASLESNLDLSNFTTGVLPVSRGGTGVGTLADGHILLGNGANAISTLDLTTKGSIVVGDGVADPIALGVGTDGHVLTADSAEASGVKWAAVSVTTPDIAEVLTEGDTSNAGQKIQFTPSVASGQSGNTQIEASGLISTYGGPFSIQHTQGGSLIIQNFNESGTDPIIINASDSYVRMDSDVRLQTNDLLDSNTSSGSAGQVLSSKGSGSGTEWITPSGGGVSSFTNLTAGDVVQWDYAVDGPNIELITVQDPNPAITQDNVITMYSSGAVSDISDIPDGATGTLIVHPTANPYFNFPTGSKLSDASNIRLDGATKVLRWVKEGDGANPSLSPTAPGYGCLYWAGFENFTTAAVIPGPDIEPAITSNLYGWWDPADYTGSGLGNTNDPATGNPYLGVVNNSTIPSKSLGGSSTGNSLTVSNSETTSGDAWEHIQFRDPAEGGASDDYKAFFLSGDGGYFLDNANVNPNSGRYTVMVWFKVNTSQADTTDLGLFDATLGGSSANPADQGLALDDIQSDVNRKAYFATRPNSSGVGEDWYSLFQKWEDDEWTCVIISADPAADDGAGGTKATIRHLMGNQYTVNEAGNSITGNGFVYDSNSITINADGTYIDWLYQDGDTNEPSDEAQASDLTAADVNQSFQGFNFARQGAGWINSFDFCGRIGLMALWDGEAKSDTDMQTLFDYSKTQFGIS